MNEVVQSPESTKEDNTSKSKNEIAIPSHEEKFVRSLCHIIVDKLDIGYIDRNQFEKLLFTSLKDNIINRNRGLLYQFLNSQLDIIAETLRKEFDLVPYLKVNYENATHAKFNDFIKAIKRKIKS